MVVMIVCYENIVYRRKHRQIEVSGILMLLEPHNRPEHRVCNYELSVYLEKYAAVSEPNVLAVLHLRIVLNTNVKRALRMPVARC